MRRRCIFPLDLYEELMRRNRKQEKSEHREESTKDEIRLGSEAVGNGSGNHVLTVEGNPMIGRITPEFEEKMQETNMEEHG